MFEDVSATNEEFRHVAGPIVPTGKLEEVTGTQWESRVGPSRAVQAGSEVHVSGTTATGDDGNMVGKDDPSEQTRQAPRSIESALQGTDASLEDVVGTRLFVTDVDKWESIGDAHSEVFGGVRPTAVWWNEPSDRA